MAGEKCARCGKPAAKLAEIAKENRKIYVCTRHAEEHGEALKRQNFVLTDL